MCLCAGELNMSVTVHKAVSEVQNLLECCAQLANVEFAGSWRYDSRHQAGLVVAAHISYYLEHMCRYDAYYR